jgi:phosphoenolpyruvate carboxykinase (ATP)
MSTTGQTAGITELLRGKNVYYNLCPAELVEFAIRRGEGKLADNGALVCLTGARTGRSPKDRFIARNADASNVNWNDINQPCSDEVFDAIHDKALAYLRGKKEIFVQELFAGADVTYRLKVRFVNENAWHNMFVWNQFVRPSAEEHKGFTPDFTVISVPGLLLDPKTDGTRSEVFIGVSFSRHTILVVGSGYAGEMKKSIFSALNYLLPEKNVFPMHCSANIGKTGDTALFFGLSGTGKTTLSADPSRLLIGDDEHGWSDKGIFNFEGGCYAKCIKLSQKNEPQIWNSLCFGAVLENVIIDAARHADYDDDAITENTRANYPVEFIDGAVIPSVGGHPKVVVFLTADAFGVLPPISKLTPEQAAFHFISGYTAKVAGTEADVIEPQATFSTCFGGPFMLQAPRVYADLLRKRMEEHGTEVWLVNTGWQGGKYGVGKRMAIPYTRAMVTAAVEGRLKDSEFVLDPAFGLAVPKHVPGVPDEVLMPRNSWADKAEYDKISAHLTELFDKNIKKFDVPDAVRNAAPKPPEK